MAEFIGILILLAIFIPLTVLCVLGLVAIGMVACYPFILLASLFIRK